MPRLNLALIRLWAETWVAGAASHQASENTNLACKPTLASGRGYEFLSQRTQTAGVVSDEC
jgi:hypothetical protein